MKHVLLSVCLTTAAISAVTILSRLSNLDGAVAMRSAISYTPNCIRSSEIVVLSSDQREVHAVVVDMPQRASLEYASPETWATLPTFDPPYDEAPTKPVLQVALN
jgi:hypothetical protein